MVNTLQEEQLVENAEKMGNYLMGGLRRIQEKYPVIGDVRGRGLMIATEFVDSAGEPSKTYTKAVQQACLSKKFASFDLRHL